MHKGSGKHRDRTSGLSTNNTLAVHSKLQENGCSRRITFRHNRTEIRQGYPEFIWCLHNCSYQQDHPSPWTPCRTAQRALKHRSIDENNSLETHRSLANALRPVLSVPLLRPIPACGHHFLSRTDLPDPHPQPWSPPNVGPRNLRRTPAQSCRRLRESRRCQSPAQVWRCKRWTVNTHAGRAP